MGTITIIEELAIESPADRVWAVLSDYHRDPEWRTGVTSMSIDADAPRAGAQTVEVLTFGGRSYRNVGELTQVGALTIAWRTVAGAHARGTRSVRPAGDGCVARLELAVTPSGAERLLAPMLARMLRRNVRGDLRRLAHLAAPVTGETRTEAANGAA